MAFFSIKHEEKKINALLATSEFLKELFDIVTKDHPEIIIKAIVQTVDKNPELYKDALEKIKIG